MSIYDKTNKSVSDAVKSILETKTKSEEILQEYESKGGKYVNKGKYGTAYEKGEIHDRRDDVAPDKRGPQATTKVTTTKPGHNDVAARFAAIQARGAPGTKHIKGKSQSGSPESREESVSIETELVEMENVIDALIQEYESKGGKYVNKGKYGTAYEKGEIHDRRDDVAPDKRGPQATNKITTTTPGHSDVAARFAAIQARGAPGTKHIKGKSQSGSPESREESVDNTNKLSFSELVSTYYTDGMNSLSESLVLVEEPTNQEFQDELKDQYDKFNGKKKGANVAAPSTVGTKEIKEEVELNEVNKLTDEEMKKREEIVKGMKKNLSSFKSRYGERAKGVMYATATKMANK